jgi:hypothetical protein
MAAAGSVCGQTQTAPSTNAKSFDIEFQKTVIFSNSAELRDRISGTFIGYLDARGKRYAGVVCTYEGYSPAILLIETFMCGGEYKSVTLQQETTLRSDKRINGHAFGYQFYFSKLSPSTSSDMNPRDYRLTVLVEPDSNPEPLQKQWHQMMLLTRPKTHTSPQKNTH